MLTRFNSRLFAVAMAVSLLFALQAGALNLAYLLPNVKVTPPKSFSNGVVLTFDDGPDSVYTLKIAKILASRKIPAVFFLVGRRVKQNAEVARELSELGFELGSHAYSHNDLTQMTRSEISDELQMSDKLIMGITGKRPRFFRPPFGTFNSEVISEAKKLNKLVVLWTLDSRDWTNMGVERLTNKVVSEAKNGSIILFHSTNSDTLEALPRILDGLSKKGLKFINLEEWCIRNFPNLKEYLVKGGKPPLVEAKDKIEGGKAEQQEPRVLYPRLIFGPVVEQRSEMAEANEKLTKLPKEEKDEKGQAKNLVGGEATREMKHKQNLRVYSNVDAYERFQDIFNRVNFLPPLRRQEFKKVDTWRDKLPARTLSPFEQGVLLNSKKFPENVYPQPRFFLLLTEEQLFNLNTGLAQRIFFEGGFSECLILVSEKREFTGDFGLPARYVTPGEFDPYSVFSLGEEPLTRLLELYKGKKESILVILPSLLATQSSETNDMASVYEFALEEFLKFRQLTYDRVYDPAEKLQEALGLPKEFSLARFTRQSEPLILICQDKPAFTLQTNYMFNRFALLNFSKSKGAEIVRISPGQLIQSEQSAIYLLPR